MKNASLGLLVLLLSSTTLLSAACTVQVEHQGAQRVVRYTLQRLSDYRQSTIQGFLDLQVQENAENGGGEALIALPTHAISEVIATKQGVVVIYHLGNSPANERREVIVPANVLRQEQVRLLITRSHAAPPIGQP